MHIDLSECEYFEPESLFSLSTPLAISSSPFVEEIDENFPRKMPVSARFLAL